MLDLSTDANFTVLELPVTSFRRRLDLYYLAKFLREGSVYGLWGMIYADIVWSYQLDWSISSEALYMDWRRVICDYAISSSRPFVLNICLCCLNSFSACLFHKVLLIESESYYCNVRSILLLQPATNTIGVVTFLTTMLFSDWDADILWVKDSLPFQ